MKISPVAAGATPTVNPNEGMSASPERMERAKAVLSGQSPDSVPTKTDPQVDRAQSSIKKLKMRTNANPTQVTTEATVPVTPENNLVTDKTDTIEQTPAATEETKPLSPQFAALAKQKRALQLKEQELVAREKAFSTQSTDKTSLEEYRGRIKANALSVLMEEGVTYDQLTEQILAQGQGNEHIAALQAEIKALKEGVDQKFTDRDTATEKQVLNQIKFEADQLIAKGDDFEMIREAGYAPKVVELIHRTFKDTGELLETTEAANLIENALLEDSLKWAKIKKVQSKLNPTPPPVEQPQTVQQDRPNTKVMRTLTNRDGASSISMSKRDRAIAAMEGRLK